MCSAQLKVKGNILKCSNHHLRRAFNFGSINLLATISSGSTYRRVTLVR